MAIVGLTPFVLRELAGRLQEFETATGETNLHLKAVQVTAFENHEPAEVLIEHALASIEHLSEIAQAMMEQLTSC